jgi:hypothetical protein
MTDQTNPSAPADHPRPKVVANNAASVPVYGLGFVGALVYFLQHAATFGAVVLGILKAMVWPAMLVYKLLELVKL